MAALNFTRLFSNSGLHSAHMKIIMLVLLLPLLIGCGGITRPVDGEPQPRATPTPTPVPSPTPVPPALTSAQVFSNTPQTWTFVSHCRNLQPDGSLGPYVEAHTVIEVRPIGPNDTSWLYSKDQPCAYWTPGAKDAGLVFNMSQTSDGNWYATGGHISFPFGAPWDSTPQDFDFTETSDPGMPRAYLIIPAQSNGTVTTVDLTTFPDFFPHTPWQTDTWVEFVSVPAYSGYAIVSKQYEGSCVPTVQHCTIELWYMALNQMGLVKVVQLYNGNNIPVDPNITMERTN